MKDENYEKAYKKAKGYLTQKAKEEGYEYYDIVEDSFAHKYGLILIGYANEESKRGLAQNVEELGHITVNLQNFVDNEEDLVGYWAGRLGDEIGTTKKEKEVLDNILYKLCQLDALKDNALYDEWLERGEL